MSESTKDLPYDHHVFFCLGTDCSARDAKSVGLALRKQISDAGLQKRIKSSKATCLGMCNSGPNMVVYPEGVWYNKLKARDVRDIVQSHLIGGKPVKRLRFNW